ncbi:MAG: DUF4115 domain-containing protein [Anaerolineales bacterium]|nr:DUF4115 domain-containing protein [Anaerolineales bacterium]MCB0004885.1 DUF4115 domain-containing protein [Anaerolineales bacterium]MCB0012315.1 DUF4115 domain-containing protein [Anaerolineales bacterium]MCB0018999.1 DUF4115 domain-containing protein [Anaerolineales bacterium]MCB0027262.1 DUF4115 domain-containing protein [Anaerolineales bacterium]
MDELGEILREAREAKGLTLEQAFAETRISQRFLAAMEAGDYDELPTPVHVRGYLRNYARFLSLDPAPLLERYENSTRKRPPLPTPNPERTPIEVAAPLPVRDDQPFFDPVNVELGAQTVKDSSATIRLGIIAAAIITLTLIAVRFVPILLGGDDGMSAIQDAVGNLLSTEETEPEAVPDGAVLAATGEPAVETSRNTSGTVDVDPEAASELEVIELPEPTPTRPQLPAVLDELNLRVDILERSWVRITIDGEVQFQGQGRAGDLFEFRALQEAQVECGNCIGVLVTINDTELGRLGGRGEAGDETWQTNAGG